MLINPIFTNQLLYTTSSPAFASVDIGGTTNYAAFAADGELTLHGTARVTNIILLAYYTTSGTASVGLNNYTYGRAFDDSVTEYVVYTGYIPKDLDGTATVYFKCRWCPMTTQTGDDVKTVYWRMYYTTNPGSGTVESLTTGGGHAASGYYTASLAVNEAQYTIHEDEWTITASAGDFVTAWLCRYGGDAVEDTCVGDVGVFLNTYIEYTSDRLGVAL